MKQNRFHCPRGARGHLRRGPLDARLAGRDRPGTIRITDGQDARRRVDVGAQGKSPGDIEIIRQRLYNQRVTERSIGRSEIICTFIGQPRSRVCRGTYFLPKGKIVVGGALLYRQFYELAVLGGTGLFNNARGTVVVTRMGVARSATASSSGSSANPSSVGEAACR